MTALCSGFGTGACLCISLGSVAPFTATSPLFQSSFCFHRPQRVDVDVVLSVRIGDRRRQASAPWHRAGFRAEASQRWTFVRRAGRRKNGSSGGGDQF